MRIAVDASGGTYAPAACIDGAFEALSSDQAPDEIILVGSKERVEAELAGRHDPRIRIEDAPDLISEHDAPTVGFRRLPRSTIVVAHELVKAGEADAVVSAGSTGAQLTAAVLTWGKLKWLLKPALAAVIPRPGKPGVLLDVGANPVVTPVHLAQFAAMGSVFAESILGIQAPRIALLSNGEEPGKGTPAVQGAHEILSRSRSVRFVGNVEGGDIFLQKADVIVTDGFTGNVFMKFAESLPQLLGSDGKGMLNSFESSRYGGIPLLGVNGVSIVCHGKSDATAFSNAIIEATRMVRLQFTGKMEKLAARLRFQRFLLNSHWGSDAGNEES